MTEAPKSPPVQGAEEITDVSVLLSKILTWVFGLPIVLWPIFSFGAIFMFDSPIEGIADEIRRSVFVYSTWLYPVLFFVPWLIARGIAKSERPKWLCLPAWALPAFVPAYYVYFFSLGK